MMKYKKKEVEIERRGEKCIVTVEFDRKLPLVDTTRVSLNLSILNWETYRDEHMRIIATHT